MGQGVRAILFICDILYQPNTDCNKFSSRYFMGMLLPNYDLHKKP